MCIWRPSTPVQFSSASIAASDQKPALQPRSRTRLPASEPPASRISGGEISVPALYVPIHMLWWLHRCAHATEVEFVMPTREAGDPLAQAIAFVHGADLMQMALPRYAAARLGAPLQRLRSRRLARASYVARRREGRFRSRRDAASSPAPTRRRRWTSPERPAQASCDARFAIAKEASARDQSALVEVVQGRRLAGVGADGRIHAERGTAGELRRVAPNAQRRRAVTSLPPAPPTALGPVASTVSPCCRAPCGVNRCHPISRWTLVERAAAATECCCGTASVRGV